MNPDTLIALHNVKMSFYQKDAFVQVVRGVSLTVKKGEIVGLLGESGSGKTATATSILRLHEPSVCQIDSGQIVYEYRDLLSLGEKDLQKIRGKKIAYIFQNPTAALNPHKTIGKQMKGPRESVIAALKEVGIEDAERVMKMYPKQLSGGQNQRVMIAQALMKKPELIIADEPTSAIDASLSKMVLDLLRDLNKKYNMSILLITHDFDVAKYLCNRLVILYGGLVMESGDMRELLEHPLHPYTQSLLRCVHSLDVMSKPFYTLEGTPLTPADFKDACPFEPRCLQKEAVCAKELPTLYDVNQRQVRCIHYGRT